MYQLVILSIIFILLIFSINSIIKKKSKSKLIKAGKKWDEIVDELRKRK